MAVLFLDYRERVYSVVPINWITQNDPLFRYWPSGNVDYKIINLTNKKENYKINTQQKFDNILWHNILKFSGYVKHI